MRSENISFAVSTEYSARLRRHMLIGTLRGRIADAAMEWWNHALLPEYMVPLREACRELAALEKGEGKS